jgi:hypothetical protein
MSANPDTKNVSGSKLCRRDRGIWAKCADIWLRGNMSSTCRQRSQPRLPSTCAAAIDVSTSVANVSNVVACMSAASPDVSAAAVDIRPLDAALAEVSTPVDDASAYFCLHERCSC